MRNLIQGVTDIPARVWAAIYLALIPLYAIIYFLLPGNQFYHSTIQYEQELTNDAAAIIAEINDDIAKNFHDAYKSDIKIVEGWEIDIRNLRVTSLRPSIDRVAILMQIVVRKQSPKGYVQNITHFEASIPAVRSTPPMPTDFYYITPDFDPEILALSDENGKYNLPYEIIFPMPNTDSRGAVLPLTKSLDQKLLFFWRGFRGLPANVSGNFWRMLYLSAVTITTVGYGDIVPITTTTRLLVASEAVLGVVVIGLFINALFQRRAKSS